MLSNSTYTPTPSHPLPPIIRHPSSYTFPIPYVAEELGVDRTRARTSTSASIVDGLLEDDDDDHLGEDGVREEDADKSSTTGNERAAMLVEDVATWEESMKVGAGDVLEIALSAHTLYYAVVLVTVVSNS